MRTTLDIDDDILQVVKDLARERRQSLGKTLSALARQSLQPPTSGTPHVGRIPVLACKPNAKPVTSQAVKDLLELDF